MARKQQTIRIQAGDIRAVAVIRGTRETRLAIYDEDSTTLDLPLIAATLTESERRALVRALGTRS